MSLEGLRHFPFVNGVARSISCVDIISLAYICEVNDYAIGHIALGPGVLSLTGWGIYKVHSCMGL